MWRMRNHSLKWLFGLLTFGLPLWGFSQVDSVAADSSRPTFVEIKNADLFESKRVGAQKRPIRKLVGNVHFVHDSTDMFCDSAYQFLDSNYIEAYSNVRILSQRSDSMRIRSEKLTYYSGSKVLELTDSVFFTDNEVSLETDRLTYYREEGMGQYFEGGILRDSANTLSSERGYYYQKEHLARFKEKVKLVNEDYTLETDTLSYNTQTDVVYFQAPTLIYDEKSELYTEQGWYDTRNELAFLYQKPYAQDSVNRLSADTIYYNHKTDSGWAKKQVKLRDLDKDLFVFGEYGVFRQNPNKTYIADSAYAINYLEGDTLYMFADTLYAEQDSNQKRQQIRAFRKVRIFMTGMQAIADSLVYLQDDSMMTFFHDPVLWSGTNQLTGDTVRIFFTGKYVDSLSVGKKAFMVTKEDTVGFSQIKSKYMHAKFRENDLVRMDNTGNVESLFYTEDDKGGYMGLNSAKCTDMTVRFKENKPVRINFKENPEGSFQPIHEVLFKDMKLEGFVWREAERPEKTWYLIPDSLRPDTTQADSLTALKDSLTQDSLRLDSLQKDSLLTPPDSLVDSLGLPLDSLGKANDSLQGSQDSTAQDSGGVSISKGKGGNRPPPDSTGTAPVEAKTIGPVRQFFRYLTGKDERPPKEERLATRQARREKLKEEKTKKKEERKAIHEEKKEARKQKKLEKMIARKMKKLKKRAERRKRNQE